MNARSLLPLCRRSSVLALAACLCLPAGQLLAQDPVNEAAVQAAQLQGQDPPSRIARLSALNGQASVEPASVDSFSPAELNLPLTTGDRLYTAAEATAAVDGDTFSVRLGGRTDLSLIGLTDRLTQLGLASGALHLRAWTVDPQTVLELDTPNLALTVLEPGDFRLEVDPASNSTSIGVIAGSAQLDAPGLSQTLHAGQWLRVGGGDAQSGEAVYAQWLRAPGHDQQDGLDAFSASMDSQYQSAAAVEGSYVSPDTVGADDLSAYGNWDQDADFGAVWYPAVVAADWQPYRQGRWCWIAPWGWTWVGSERWGFAPYHYGRWGLIHGRWGWLPGPRVPHPVYAPALVAFVGRPGSGTAAWFPLGPREAFVPWYNASSLYQNRVNAANLPTRNLPQARRLYDLRDNLAFAPPTSFANRGRGTVAVPDTALSSGRLINLSTLRDPAGQLINAPVLPHPLVNPTRQMVSPALASAVPARLERPALVNRQLPVEGRRSMSRTQAEDHSAGRTAAAITGQSATGSGTRNPADASTGTGQGDGATQPLSGTVTRVGPPGPVNSPVVSPMIRPAPPVAGQQTRQNSAAEPGTMPATRAMPGTMAFPARGAGSVTGGAGSGATRSITPPVGLLNQAPPQSRTDAPGSGTVGRPLVNRETPPVPRPTFEQQRQGMQSDPGRPLDPQQMLNVRENRPAGLPVRPEPIPHPAPAATPAAPPARPMQPPPASRPAATAPAAPGKHT